MANLASFADVINVQNNGNPITIASTTTLHQSFKLGSSAALLTVPNPMAAIESVAKFPGLSAQARPFLLRAAGTVVGGEKYQIDIVQGTGLTPVIASTGLATGGLANDNWLLECELLWDASSLFLRGAYWGWTGSTLVALSALSQVVSPAALANLQFNVALTIASANANASFSLTEFAGEFV